MHRGPPTEWELFLHLNLWGSMFQEASTQIQLFSCASHEQYTQWFASVRWMAAFRFMHARFKGRCRLYCMLGKSPPGVNMFKLCIKNILSLIHRVCWPIQCASEAEVTNHFLHSHVLRLLSTTGVYLSRLLCFFPTFRLLLPLQTSPVRHHFPPHAGVTIWRNVFLVPAIVVPIHAPLISTWVEVGLAVLANTFGRQKIRFIVKHVLKRLQKSAISYPHFGLRSASSPN